MDDRFLIRIVDNNDARGILVIDTHNFNRTVSLNEHAVTYKNIIAAIAHLDNSMESSKWLK